MLIVFVSLVAVSSSVRAGQGAAGVWTCPGSDDLDVDLSGSGRGDASQSEAVQQRLQVSQASATAATGSDLGVFKAKILVSIRHYFATKLRDRIVRSRFKY